MKAKMKMNLSEDGQCCFNTTMNTVGIGDPVPAGQDFGSGDKFGNSISKPAVKKSYIKVKKRKKKKE